MCLGNETPTQDRRRALQSKEESTVVCPSTALRLGAETPDSAASESKHLFSSEAPAGQFGLTVPILLGAPWHIWLGWGQMGWLALLHPAQTSRRGPVGKTKAEECMSPLRKCFPASASVLLLNTVW